MLFLQVLRDIEKEHVICMNINMKKTDERSEEDIAQNSYNQTPHALIILDFWLLTPGYMDRHFPTFHIYEIASLGTAHRLHSLPAPFAPTLGRFQLPATAPDPWRDAQWRSRTPSSCRADRQPSQLQSLASRTPSAGAWPCWLLRSTTLRYDDVPCRTSDQHCSSRHRQVRGPRWHRGARGGLVGVSGPEKKS